MATLRDYITRVLADNPEGMELEQLRILLDEDKDNLKHNLTKMWHKSQVAYRDDKWFPAVVGQSTGTSTVVEEMRLRKIINDKFQMMEIRDLRRLAVIVQEQF